MAFNRSHWHTLAYDGARRLVWIVDEDDGAVSVTNDAEAVVAELYQRHPACRFIYRDSMGNWDELLHANGVFAGFAPARHLAPQ
jgi:YD repeat-containing protein